MSEREFEAGGRKFQLSKIGAFEQFHVVRRLGPILGELAPIALKLSKAGLKEIDPDHLSEDQLQMFAPIMKGLSELSDEDANRVLLGLCSSAEMYQPATGNWAKVARPDGLMFQDLELGVLMQIAGHAFMYNLQSFFSSAHQVSHGGK